ncbi:Retrovirus-related Pol poly from transposon TNT 1-94, partial [Durusdinium trenchii]
MTTATERTKGHDLLWWHNALGHVPFRAIMDIHKEAREMKIDGDLDPAILEDCATCIRNNSKRKQVKKGLKPRPLYFLHYVGLDVIPETEVGIGGYKFTAFFSHHGYGSFFAVPMRTKKDLAKAYLKHRTYLGAPTILESDDEAIITKGDFSDLLLRENVLAKHTAPRNHRSNTVERYIQDYKRMYQALIDHAGLEQRLGPYGLVKHLAVTIAFIHDHVEAGTINPAKVDTKENIADLGTKPVSLDVFRRLSPALTGDA